MSNTGATITAMGARRLVGKNIFIIAGAQGIGRAIALRLKEEGAAVTATDLNAAELKKLEASGIKTIVSDATDAAALAAALDTMPRMDVLVICVGWVHQGTILECTPEVWARSFKINVDPFYNAIRHALPRMIAAGKGNIINIASPASSMKAVPNRAAYSASKAAVLGLTKSVAIDYVKQGIRCNAICPGTTESPSLEDRIHAFADPVAARAAFIARQPMGRLGKPEEMAAMAAYLASDESDFASGAFMVVDGAGTI
jgi:2-keto-3-deoxy-L-fuconate dehydrogenase